jgi:hypothetical protein
MILIPSDLALHPNEQRVYFEVASGVDIVVRLRSDRSDYTLLRWLIEVEVRYAHRCEIQVDLPYSL